MIKDQILFSHQYSRISNKKCLSCNNTDHFLKRCPLVTYQPDKDFLIEKLNYTKPQKRHAFSRRNSTYFTLKKRKDCYKAALSLRFDKRLMGIYQLSVEDSRNCLSVVDESDENLSFDKKSIRKSVTYHPKSLKMFNISSNLEEKAKSMNNFQSSIETISLIRSCTEIELPKEQDTKNIRKSFSCDRKNFDLSINTSLEANNRLGFNKTLQSPLKIVNRRDSNPPFNSAESILSPGISENKSPCLKKERKSEENDMQNSKSSLLKGNASPNNRRKTRKSLNFKELTSKDKEKEPGNKEKEENTKENEKEVQPLSLNLSLSKDLFWKEFECMKNFKNYFPENNALELIKPKKKGKNNQKTSISSRKLAGSPIMQASNKTNKTNHTRSTKFKSLRTNKN